MQQDQSATLANPVNATSKKPVPFFKAAPRVKAILPFLSNTPLSDWRGSVTTFAGVTGTLPVRELENETWSEISALLAPSEPAILEDKKQGQYVVPSILKEAKNHKTASPNYINLDKGLLYD
ncbi:MAG: hypothetical protein HOP25_09845 [Methylotenera sp.]|nr:hypothetical protein [Methylotenera sp.]